MKIGMVGLGAVGGVIAARLRAAGTPLTVVVRREAQAEALRRAGLALWQGSSVRAVALPDVLTTEAMRREMDRDFDLIIVASKSAAMGGLAEEAFKHLSTAGVLMLVQNGLPEEVAGLIVPRRRLIGGVVGWNAVMTGETRVTLVAPGELLIGTVRGGNTAMLPHVAQALAPVGDIRLTDNFAGARWSKLAISCVINALAAISGLPLGAIFARYTARRLAIGLLREVQAVMTALEIAPEPLGGTPALDTLLAQRPPVIHAALLALGLHYRGVRPSSLHDIAAGQATEIDALNGAVVRHAAAKGVPVPINAALLTRVAAIEAGRIAPSPLAFGEVAQAARLS